MYIRYQRESQDIFEESRIHIGTTSCAVSPHHVLEIIGIDVVPYNQDTLDDHTAYLTEYEISNLGTEILGLVWRSRNFAPSTCTTAQMAWVSNGVKTSLTESPFSLRS